jgi:putative chitinase
MDLSNLIPAEWAVILQPLLSQYNIDTPQRIAGFLSQVDIESAHFTALSENLNYSAHGLLTTFGSHFTEMEADSYAHKPEAIANRVYGGRMGNGAESSGDGWKYRGRGLIQLTGLTNYNAFALACGKTTDETVAYLETKEGAAHAACWFWANNNLNQFADIGDNIGMCKRINGGTNGLTERHRAYDKFKAQLC